MCGATQQQQDLSDEESNFYQEMTAEATSAFGAQSAITGALTNEFAPILAAGPSQKGFSDAENTDLSTQAGEGVGAAYKSASTALGKQVSAQGGGDAFLPSGGTSQLEGNVDIAGAQQLASEKNQINLANYQQGNANFNTAASVLGNTAATINPTGVASATTGAGSVASNTANQIAAENMSPWTTAIGALGGLAGKAVGGINYSSGSGFSYGG